VSAPAAAGEYFTAQLALAALVTGSTLPLPSVQVRLVELGEQLALRTPVSGSTVQVALVKVPPALLVNCTSPVGIVAEPVVLSTTVAVHVLVSTVVIVVGSHATETVVVWPGSE
jgi:hypothetical protein